MVRHNILYHFSWFQADEPGHTHVHRTYSLTINKKLMRWSTILRWWIWFSFFKMTNPKTKKDTIHINGGCWGCKEPLRVQRWQVSHRVIPTGLNSSSTFLSLVTQSSLLWKGMIVLHLVVHRFAYLKATLFYMVQIFRRPPMGLFFSCEACMPAHICPAN